MVTEVMQRPGYTIPEVERILGIAPKSGYQLVHADKIKVFTGLDGRWRVSELELVMYMSKNQ